MKPTLVTVGTFDGLHLGHQSLLKQAKELSQQLHLKLLALTFPHPPRVFFKEPTRPYLLSSPEEKQYLFSQMGVELEILPFDWHLAEMSARNFYELVLKKKFHAKALLLGYNFRFGKNREGDFSLLEEWGKTDGTKIYRLPSLDLADAPISSGRVREAIAENNLLKAQELLGHHYFVIGTVERGQGIGHKLGFPTANIKIYPYKLLPGGVYHVQVEFSKQVYDGVANVGFRPSLAAAHSQPILEVHLLNFSGNLYGENLRVVFCERLRDEKKFGSLEELQQQISLDIAAVLKK